MSFQKERFQQPKPKKKIKPPDDEKDARIVGFSKANKHILDYKTFSKAKHPVKQKHGYRTNKLKFGRRKTY